MSPIPATLLAGDGIGPEIVEAVVTVMDVLGRPFAWEVCRAGSNAVSTDGDPLPAATVASIRKTGLALKGPLATPVGGGYRSVNVRLREEFQLYANLRPVRTLMPGGRYEDIDIVMVRENLEGLYVGFEHYIPVGDDPQAVAIASGVNSRAGSRRIAKFAFDYALAHGRKKVTIVHKANVLKALTGLFLDTAKELAREYGGRRRVTPFCRPISSASTSITTSASRRFFSVSRIPVQSSVRKAGPAKVAIDRSPPCAG